MNEMNQALRHQSSHSQWLLELDAPSVALGRGLPRDEFAAKPFAANANRPRAGLIEALVRTMRQRETAKLLKQLDPQRLDDIGVSRGDIEEIATKAAAAAVRKGTPAMPRIASLTKLPASILTFLTKAWRRRAAIAALQRLSNHTLADIGIERARIAQTIDAMMARDETMPAPVRAPVTAAPVTGKVTTAKPVGVAAPAHKLAA
jgi:uncharacterized protein YjiS (DUF1127 family)